LNRPNYFKKIVSFKQVIEEKISFKVPLGRFFLIFTFVFIFIMKIIYIKEKILNGRFEIF